VLPDLHEKVKARELSAHAAMVQAGLRRKTVTVPIDPPRRAEAIVRHLSIEDALAVVEGIRKEREPSHEPL